ncbi:hypothetical protein [Dermatophilus congolensis]|uniref:hypothetical protein n=1 Tax=Dermatophilus congolensis TaxID=1863 RepID=UPI003C7E799A
MSTWLHKQHAQAGTHLIRGRVTHITTSDTHITADIHANDNTTYSITTDIAITCTGFTPETTLAEKAGIATINGIIVTPINALAAPTSGPSATAPDSPPPTEPCYIQTNTGKAP